MLFRSGKPPRVQGPIGARNLLTVVVGSLGNQAFITTNTPQKIALDSVPKGETGADGLELKDLTPGNHDLIVGDGPEQKKLVVTFGPVPILTAFAKSDVNSGTLVVATGEDGATVYVDGKQQRRRTQRGQLRVPALGNVTVRVEKEGFQPVLEKTATVAKGEEKRLEFKLVPLPQVASLQIRGAAAGTAVFLGDREIGVVAPDGIFSAANLPPGDHPIELRRQGYANKRITRTFKAGETVTLTGPDIAMVATTATVRLNLNPPETQVTYRHSDEMQSHAVKDSTLRIESGSYVFTAHAPGYVERIERVQVGAGENRPLDLTLQKVVAAPAVRAPAAVAMDWSKAGWTQEDNTWVKKGGNFVVVRPGPVNGVIAFTAELKKGGGFLRGAGKIRWFVDFTNSKNYALFELDKKTFVVKDVHEGRSIERDRTQHNSGDLRSVDVQVDVSPDRVVTRLKVGQQWVVLDTWNQSGRDFTDGKFGFLVPGSDEIGIASFRFNPR